MDKVFVDLYKRVSLDASNEQINKRMQGVEESIKEIDDEMVKNLIKIFADKPINKGCIEEFGQYFYNQDYSFEMDNKVELSILAGYILHKLILDVKWKEKIISILTVLSILNMENKYNELYEEAFAIFEDMMFAAREQQKELKTPNLKSIDVEVLKKSLLDADGINADNVGQLCTILNMLDNNIRTVREQNKKLQNEVKKYKEESQILSWIVGEWCNWKNAPLKELEAKSITLFLGRELAGFVNVYPGPLAAKAFLVRMISKTIDYNNNEFSLSEIVNILSDEDKMQIVSEFQEYDLSYFPIVMAINDSQKVDGSEEWYPLYKKDMGVHPEEIKRSSQEWAYQFYLENIAKMALQDWRRNNG